MNMPAESAEGLVEVAPGLVEVFDGAGRYRLLGSRCPDCKAWAFPAIARCPLCQGRPAPLGVGASGSLYTYTVVRTRAPFGLPEPYAVGYVDLDESGLRVFGLIDPSAADELEVGQHMEIGLRQIGVDGRGRPCLRPLFYPAGRGRQHG